MTIQTKNQFVNEPITESRPQSNYQLVFDLLKETLVSETHPYALAFKDRRPTLLRELRTIRMGGGRLSGKTTWLVEFLIEHIDDTILFVKDETLRLVMLNSWIELNPRVKEEDFNKLNERIITQRYFKSTIQAKEHPMFNKGIMKKAPKYILIDDAQYHIHFFIKVLHDWISETADVDPIIVLMN